MRSTAFAVTVLLASSGAAFGKAICADGRFDLRTRDAGREVTAGR